MNCEYFGLQLKNPIIAASGPWGFLHEWEKEINLNLLGAGTLKTTTPLPRLGNETPRMTEVCGGLLNSIGLQNPGVEKVLTEEIPKLSSYNFPLIGNVGGFSVEDYVVMVKAYDQEKGISAIEVNVSCPNVKQHGANFAHDESLLKELMTAIRPLTKKPLIVKLSPNLPSLVPFSQLAEDCGMNGLTIANTYVGLKIDLQTKRPILANKTGGLSGPAIKALTMRHVFEVAQKTKLPIIALGGVSNANDVVEYILAGASLVGIGSTILNNPQSLAQIVKELPSNIHALRGLAWK